MNAIVELPQRAEMTRLSVAEVLSHVKAVQEVMETVMKEGLHYGPIPGTDKPTLFKQGAEKLCLAFRIADEYRIEDLSTPETARYRITCVGVHQVTGSVLGHGVGECSSAEEKYRWRKAVCKEEFDATPPDHRRVKYGRKSGGHYTVDQVRTESADMANTVLKMAAKRAKVAMTLNVTAAGDIFGQDLEDLDEMLRQHLAEDDRASHAATVREEWIGKVKASQDAEGLKAVMKEGVKVFQASKDRDGYAEFAKAVQQRGAELKGTTNA